MIFTPLFAFFTWLKDDATRSRPFSIFPKKAEFPPVSPLGLGVMDPGTAVSGDRALATVHPSSVSNGLSDSDHERLHGVVTIDIHPNRLGQVKFAGGWWSAKCGRAIIIKAGTLVHVIGRENISLIVEPVGERMTRI